MLGRVLRPYGVRSKTIWIGNEAAKGYLMEDFEEAFKRYIPRSEWEALKAEWRVEEEGRKSVATEPKSEAGDRPSQGGGTPEDDAAAA